MRTDELTPAEVSSIRWLLAAAFGDDPGEAFENSDWEHALGGAHVVLDLDGEIVAHAALVERELQVDGRPVRTGYVEAVATAPATQGRGYGTLVMREVNALIAARYELGALGTGSHHFYERLGWQTWRGPSWVRLSDGRMERTPDEDGYILVLAVPATPRLDLTAPISCEWRSGDVW